MPHTLKEFYFDRYRLDAVERCLYRDKELLPLTGKEFEMLQFFLESEGRLVTKEDLYTRLWPDVRVEQSNLFQHIRSLRKKLGERQDGNEFIKNVHGRGYCFLAGEAVPDSLDGAPQIPAPELREQHRTAAKKEINRGALMWYLVGAAFVTGLTLSAAAFYLNRWQAHSGTGDGRNAALSVIDSPDGVGIPRILRSLQVGAEPMDVLLSPDGKRLYVAEFLNQSVSIVDTALGAVTKRIAVGSQPISLASSPDGGDLYVAHLSGGVSVIDTVTNTAHRVAGIHDSVLGLAVTPDGKSAYLAMGFLGIGKLDLKTEEWSVVSKTIYVQALALTSDGRYLYVSYQGGGPGGSAGHDAIGYFDTSTDRFMGAIKGFANVGGFMAIAPDGSELLEDGGDACDSPQYDHVGCPFVPGGILNVIDIDRKKYVRSIGIRGTHPGRVVFSQDGQFAILATGERLIFISPTDLKMVASLPILSPGKLAFTRDGSMAYAPVMHSSSIAVIQMVVPFRAFPLTNREGLDGTFPVTIVSSADCDAKAVDPTTLKMGNEPVMRDSKGILMASIEMVTGFPGHSLIVHFKRDVTKGNSRVQIEGKTYAGLPIRAVMEPF